MLPFSAVLFDFGDTLFHSPSGADVLAEAGVDRAAAERVWGQIWQESKTPRELALGRDLSADRHRSAWLGLFRAADELSPGIGPALYERVMLTGRWLPYPDTRPVLTRVRELGARVGVVSNIPEPLRPLFARHGLDGLVDEFTESHEQGVAKPDPELFLIACRRLGVEPAAALMVGDSAAADGAAAAAGLTVLLLPEVPPGSERGLVRVLGLLEGRLR